MKARATSLFLSAAALLVATHISGEVAPPVSVEIQWNAVPGAHGYVLQIKDVKTERMTTFQSRETRTVIEVPPGEYERRIAALNKFRRASAWSSWTPLSVRLTRRPEILDVSPPTIRAERFGTHRFQIRGQSFLPGMVVAIQGPEKDLTVVEIIRNSESTAEFVLDATQATPGRYNLILRNPGDMETRLPSAIHLTHEPEALPVAATEPTIAGLEAGQSLAAALPPKKPAPRRAEPKPPTRELPLWQALVPGLPQMLRGNDSRAWIYWGTLGALTAGGAAAWATAEGRATSQASSLLFQSFNNPILYLTLRDSLVASPSGLLLYAAGRQEFSRSMRGYERSQRLAAGAAATALIAYGIHLWDALSNSTPPTAAPESKVAGSRFYFGIMPTEKSGRQGIIGVEVRF